MDLYMNSLLPPARQFCHPMCPPRKPPINELSLVELCSQCSGLKRKRLFLLYSKCGAAPPTEWKMKDRRQTVRCSTLHDRQHSLCLFKFYSSRCTQ